MSGLTKPLPEDATQRLPTSGPALSVPREALRPERQYLPGRRWVERYTVLQVLGEGGMGVVLAAYDERLDRRVALKLLRQGASEGSDMEGRLVREAQAMARLSHPNVVAVYDSGKLEDGTFFIAMEYVEGRTLQAWCEQGPRPWRQVLGAFLEAGRGLAAAHAVGLIHRDFKPVNVLVGNDERVRVTDFGVARVDASHAVQTPATPVEVSLSSGAWESCLTLPGSVVGTPRYLAPELLKGLPADARSDVFAFCVALYEALYGQPAFAGDSMAERMRAQKEGRFSPPPARTEVPAWVGRALVRGLSAVPASRPDSMQALLALLEDDPEVRWRERWRAALLSGGALALGALATWGWARGQGPGCGTVAQRRLEGVWDEAVRARVGGALRGTGLSYATDTALRVEAALEAYSGAWVRMSQEVCEVAGSRAEGVRGFSVLREACLERRRSQLRALTELLSRGPDPALASKAVQLAQALPSLAYCADERSLLAAVPPPEEPALRARVEELQQELDRLAALHEGGKYAEGLAQAQALLARVATVDFEPLRARALFQLAQLQEKAGDYKGAEARLREAIPLAASGGDASVQASAWSLLLFVIGERQGRPQEALGLELSLEAAVAQARDEEVRASALQHLGGIFWLMGRYEEALSRIERSLVLLEKALGPEHPHMASTLNRAGVVLWRMGRYEEARARHERALALRERLLGPEHPDVARSLSNLGLVLLDMGRYEEARARHELALALMERALGPEHPHLAWPLNSLGEVLSLQGQHEQAQVHLARALALRHKALGPEHPEVARSLNSQGLLLARLDRHEEARAHHERALALLQKALGPEHPDVAGSLLGLGRLHLAQRRPAQALPFLERALALALGQEKAEAQLSLAQALWDSGAERRRAVALATEAHSHWRALRHPRQAQALQWLATHAP